ncbi:hypothetical protein [Anaplasma capra]|uniref:hypothetical protein n=1 Tax=Anaplasma capra TaxID=1562740 RepID=UPI0021D5AAFC|nr:hypothetical protein [Anaplasma capra]MCU7611684.1 hypothetical protein [Anaplasma capra]MCU7612166.1 hypothetical protein [Anaplasma capra]
MSNQFSCGVALHSAVVTHDSDSSRSSSVLKTTALVTVTVGILVLLQWIEMALVVRIVLAVTTVFCALFAYAHVARAVDRGSTEPARLPLEAVTAPLEGRLCYRNSDSSASTVADFPACVDQSVQQEIGDADNRLSEMKDILYKFGIREICDGQSADHTILTLSYCGKFCDVMSQALPRSDACVAFYLNKQQEILCVLGEGVFRVDVLASRRSRPAAPGSIQIVLRAKFPQGMHVTRQEAKFRRSGPNQAKLVYPLKVEVTPENLLLAMIESGVCSRKIGGLEALRSYLEFYSRSFLSGTSGYSSRYREGRCSRLTQGPSLQMPNGTKMARFMHDIIEHKRAFKRLLTSESITKLEKKFLDSTLRSSDTYGAEAASTEGTSLEFISALYALTCTHEQFFKDLDSPHYKREVILKFLTDKNLRVAMVIRTLNATYKAIRRIKKKGAHAAIDSIINEGAIERDLPYLCRQLPALFESVYAILLTISCSFVHSGDCDTSLLKWFNVVPGFGTAKADDVVKLVSRCAELCGITSTDSGCELFLIAAEIVAKLELGGDPFLGDSIPKAIQALLKMSEGEDGRHLVVLKTSLAKLSDDSLRQVVAFAVACEIADLVAQRGECSISALSDIFGPEINSQAILGVLDSVGECPGFFASLMSEVVYVHYPPLDYELIGMRSSLAATEQPSSLMDSGGGPVTGKESALTRPKIGVGTRDR